jgi:serine/threonine protein phosphatase 1
MELTYAVGDIHGCHGLLVQLLDAIETDAGGRPHMLVFVGDYIDKGPDSAGVIDTLMRLQMQHAHPVICLKGNHDCLMVEAAASAAAEEKWLTMGGAVVLAQYGVARAADLPAAVLAWMDTLPTYHENELQYFVHAGVDPAYPLAAQTDAIRKSMRGIFLEQDHDFGKHIVHGHTPQLSGLPELRPYRTNLDTGVVVTGRLTGAAFENGQRGPRRILQTRIEGGVTISAVGKLPA